jgi:deoxycytidylate deaminase
MKCLKMAKILNDETSSDIRHFSFLVRKNSVNSIGYNNTSKTHTIADKIGYRYPTIHSELSTILNFSGKEISDYYMINFRFDKMGNLSMSKPCNNCQNLLKHYGIVKVVYSTGYGFKIWS